MAVRRAASAPNSELAPPTAKITPRYTGSEAERVDDVQHVHRADQAVREAADDYDAFECTQTTVGEDQARAVCYLAGDGRVAGAWRGCGFGFVNQPNRDADARKRDRVDQYRE